MKTAPKIVLAGVAFLALTQAVACGLVNQANASAVVVATVLYTPPTGVPADALAFDAGVPNIDAGISIDAGVTVPSESVVAVFFGNKGANLDVAPTGVAGATVTLQEVGGARFPLIDQGGGNYGLGADAGFTYKPGVTYDVTVEHAGQSYVGEVANTPQVERIAQFHPAKGYVEQPANTAFTFTRPEPAGGQELPLGFVTVVPLTAQGAGSVTYTNVPQTPLQFLKLVVAPSDWKKQTVEVPGTAFPEANANYLIILQSAKLGGPKTENLFLGSPILAGTADVAIVKTNP
ncbi:MAG: hypothetical protein AB1730_02945 [Myxococcota bacterium]